MHPIITVFNIPVSTFLLLQVFGGLLGIGLMLFKRSKFGIEVWDFAQTVAVALIGGAPGAVLLNAIFKLIEQGANSGVMPAIWQMGTWKWALSQGSCFYGSLFGAAIAVLVFAKLRRLPTGKLLGLMTYFVSVTCVVGRLGCYSADCCYGITLSNGAQFPSQLVETGYCVLILLFFLIARLERRNPDVMFPSHILYG